jgi:hypothetical protein
LVRKPSRTVTGALAADPPELELELELAEPADVDDEEEQPASRRAAPIIAALITRRIST